MRVRLRSAVVGASLAGLVVAMVEGPSLFAQRADPQTPQFRGVADIVAIDFLALRSDGLPVVDLSQKEITVKVDGRVRDIRSFQFVKVSSAERRDVSTVTPDLPLPFGTNDTPTPGRAVIIVVDHEQIRASEAKLALAAASRFLDRLTSLDRVGLVTLPNGRVEVDLTTNHARVRKALESVVGRAQRKTGIGNISLDEAMTVLAELIDPDKKFTLELVDRECRFAPNDSACRPRVVQEALAIARQTELETRTSLNALKGFLEGLVATEGPKAIVFLSGSLVAFPETRLDLEDVARASARARAQMFVVQPHDTLADASVRDQPPSMTADIDHRVTGLQDLAGVTGGDFFRMTGTGDLVFGRIANQISAYYLLGFEPRSGESNGKPHRIEIATTRPGVSVRARPMFIIDDPKRAAPSPPAVRLEPMLRDFGTYRDLPLRATAYTFRDVDPKNVKIVVALESTEETVTLNAAAFALIDVNGGAAAQWTEDGASVVNRPLLTGTTVPPGEYRLRVAALDTAGRRGAVDYEFVAQLSGGPGLTMASLMAGSLDQGNFRPRLVFEARDTSAHGYLEFYGTFASGTAITASFEVALTPDGPALAGANGQVLAAAQTSRFVATGAVPLARLGAGDYILRAVIKVNDIIVGRTIRAIRKKS